MPIKIESATPTVNYTREMANALVKLEPGQSFAVPYPHGTALYSMLTLMRALYPMRVYTANGGARKSPVRVSRES